MPRRSKTQELLEFEISFYEKLLGAYPDFVDVLTPLGDAYTRRGLHEKGLEVDLRLAKVRSEDPLIWYNLACSYSLLKRAEESIAALKRAIELGYSDLSYLRRDPDLIHLRQSPMYRSLLETLTARADAKTKQAHSSTPKSPH